MSNNERCNSRAFSLVEISVVLVIIGLVAGGVLTGQSMIRSAELRSLTNQVVQYSTAVTIFKDKYFALPGDMANATAFWGEADPVLATCKDTVGSGSETCNGDGNGQIGRGGGMHYERFRFWQQLSNANLVVGDFSGVAGHTNAYHVVPGENAPTPKYDSLNSALAVLHWTPITSNTYKWRHIYGNIITYGTNNTPHDAWDVVLSPQEAWNIDHKIDDGFPSTGKVVTFKDVYDAPTANHHECHTSQDDNTAEYALTNEAARCSLVFVLGF